MPRRARPSIGNSLSEWLPVGTRVGLHATVVVVATFSAFLGGGRILSASPTAGSTGATPVQAQAKPAPTAEVVQFAMAQFAPPAGSASYIPTPVTFALGSEAALQEAGVLVSRTSASSRGGSRALDEAPKPVPTVAPTAAPSPTPAPKKEALKPRTYTVAAGDTFLDIAYRAGITPESILWANNLQNAELLQIGQELTIPPVSGVLHKVSSGDTLLKLAEAYGAQAGDIVEANLLENSDNLQEGQLLVVPGGMMRTTEITGLPSAPSAKELAAAPRYKVKEGDTLVSIADAFGVRPSVIQVANNLMNPDLLSLGLELAIPGGKAQPAPAPKPAPAAAPAPKPQPQAAAPAPKPAPAPAPAPKPAPVPVSGDTGDRIAAIAQKYIGYRYVWGGHSPSGFDCSGYSWYVYKEAGVSIPLHDLWGQLNAGPRIAKADMLPGDLIFFQNTYKAGLSHVGIYLGGGRWINAEDENSGVQVRGINDGFWAQRFVGASRPW